MISLQIKSTKTLMNRLLLTEAFDSFLLSEAQIITFNTFAIDGRLQKEFYTSEELSDPALADRQYSCWQEVRPYCLELIRGKKTPLSFKFVFLLSASNTKKLLEQSGIPIAPSDVNGLFINLRYHASSATVVTGTSLKLFTMDKTLEHTWDQMVKKFLEKQGIDFEEL